MRYVLLPLLAFLLPISAMARQESPRPDLSKPLYFEHFTAENALPENSVFKILQDKFGYIWLATQAGPVRYDGTDFKLFEPDLSEPDARPINVRAMVEDQNGNIWMAGGFGSGMAMLDRKTEKYHFYRVSTGEADDRIKNTFFDVFVDPYGDVWFTYKLPSRPGFGLVRIDSQTRSITEYEIDPSDPTALHAGVGGLNTDAAIYATADSSVWIGTRENLHLYDRQKDSFKKVLADDESIGEREIPLLFERSNGELWFATAHLDGSGIAYKTETCILNRPAFTTECFAQNQNLVDRPISFFSESPQGSLTVMSMGYWCTFSDSSRSFICNDLPELADKGTSYTIPTTGEVLEGRAGVVPSHVLSDDNGNYLFLNGLAIITRIKFLIFDSNQNQMREISSSIPGRIGSINDLFQDRQGTIWVGGQASGLARLDVDRARFEFLDASENSIPKLPSNEIFDLDVAEDGTVWVAHAKGLSKVNTSSKSIATLTSQPIQMVEEDSQGRVWVVSNGKFGQFWPRTGKIDFYGKERSDLFFLSPAYSDIMEDSKGRIWVASALDGLSQYLPESKSFRTYPVQSRPTFGESDSLSSRQNHCLFETQDKYIWICTDSAGLSRFDPDSDRFFNSYDPGGLSRPTVGLAQDSEGQLWIANGLAGVTRFNPETGTETSFTENDGLAYNWGSSVQIDADGDIWVGTKRGLSKINPQTEEILSFGKQSGLPTLGFKSTSVVLPNGQLMFASTDGILLFHPDDMLLDTTPPLIVIESVSFRSKSTSGVARDSSITILDTASISLSSNENDLAIEYAGFYFRHPSGNQYSYRLLPLESDWILAGSQREVRYSNLSPGSYTFEVQVTNANGVTAVSPASLEITIRPPWWRTFWAYLFYAGALGFVGYRVDRSVRARIIEKERQKQHEKLAEAHSDLAKAHGELKSTQAQLVEQEKLASLGSLTAGIAHEIKNPLNFVNNFAEVGAEMADELSAAIAKGDTEEAQAIIAELRENATQITKHGRRADDIVRSMMQHASGRASEREVVAINAFIEEYANLAWHGMRAKDEGFQADLVRDYSEDVGSLSVLPQELGRVVLNLLSNAFDAVKGLPKGQVTLQTRNINGGIEIRVSDNGPGVPEEIQSKIFEPFFTTKPTGEGTGLGLSLSYDIITKGHGGTMTVDSTPVGGATFIIILPGDVE